MQIVEYKKNKENGAGRLERVKTVGLLSKLNVLFDVGDNNENIDKDDGFDDDTKDDGDVISHMDRNSEKSDNMDTKEEKDRINEKNEDEDKNVSTFDAALAQEELERKLENEDSLENKEPTSWIEMVYATVVESLSSADLITDSLIVIQLANDKNHNHQWWISLMILMMISPYLVSYSVLGSLFKARMTRFIRRIKLNERNNNSNNSISIYKCKWILFSVVCLILMTPLSLLYFVVIDIIFMIYVLLSTLIYFFSCSKINISDSIDDLIFKKFLGMNRMQIIGYRRLRTLSQLVWETSSQIVLQIRIYFWLQTEEAKVGNSVTVSATSILISLVFASLHAIFEASIIYLDSTACNMSFLKYGFHCLGARLEW